MRDLLHRLGYEYKKPKCVLGNPDLEEQEILLIEGTKYYYSKAVQEALKDYPRVRYVFLPSYSPNLGLIERFWGFFKKKMPHNRYHKDIRSFRRACIEFFRNIDQRYAKIASLMGGGFDICYT